MPAKSATEGVDDADCATPGAVAKPVNAIERTKWRSCLRMLSSLACPAAAHSTRFARILEEVPTIPGTPPLP
jgi:hypothetical protein